MIANKITVSGGKNDTLKLMLWFNNKKLGYVTNVDMDIDGYDEENMDVSFQHYQNYLRECLIEMIKQGAIAGLIYDDSTYEEEQDNKPKTSNKMFAEQFKIIAKQKVEEILKEWKFEYKMEYDVHTLIKEQFKDKSVKDAVADIGVVLNKQMIKIIIEVHNGQLCKPRKLMLDDDEYNFNKTNVKMILDGKQPRK